MQKNEAISKNPIYETFFVIIGAYFSYALAHLDFFQLSGDVAIFFYGVVMSHYNKYNLSLESFKSIGLSFNILMQLSEAVCFIYIGLSFEDAIRGHLENLIYAGAISASLLFCRSIVVAIVACIKKNQNNFRVKGGEWFGVISSAMVKGPLSYIFINILIPGKPECIDVFNKEHYAIAYPIFVMQICVVSSLLLLHPLNYIVFKLLVKESLYEGDDVELKHERAKAVKEQLLDNNWIVDRERPRVFGYVDEFFLKPLLIRDYHNRKGAIQKMKELYDDLSSKYDHGVHLEHEVHEKAHQVCGDGHGGHHGGHHGEHDPHHGFHRALTDFELLDDETKKRRTFWRGIRKV